MKMYEIDEALQECFNEETGEILDEEKFNALEEERDKKIEGIGLMIKERAVLIEGIDAEMKRLRERKETLKNQNESTKDFLDHVLGGKKFETERVRCMYRKSKAVDVIDEGQVPEKYIKETVKTAPDKTAIKEAIQAGETVPGCELRESNNLSVK